MADKLSLEILSLEAALQSQAIRSDPEKLEHLLAADFIEFSSTGNVYGKPATIESLLAEPARLVTMHNFHARPLAPDLALATYETIDEENSTVLRSSIWKRKGEEWQIVFHQGTPRWTKTQS